MDIIQFISRFGANRYNRNFGGGGRFSEKRLFLSAPVLVHVMDAAVASNFAESKNLGFLTAIVAVFWEPHRLSCYFLATDGETDYSPSIETIF